MSKLRGGPNPNLRVQDGIKLPFLCKACEKLLESWETPFADQVFYPLHREPQPARIEYSAWGLKFAVSVSWRVLKMHSEEDRFLTLPSNIQSAAADALREWRSFMRGESPHPGIFEQHFIPFDLVEQPVPGMSEFFNRYIVRSVDEDLGTSDDTLLVYSKLGKLVLFGVVPAPSRMTGWRSTKVHVRRGAIDTNTADRLPGGIVEFVNSKAEDACVLLDSMSSTQATKVAEARQAGFRGEPAAEVFRAFAYDRRIREINLSRSPNRGDA